MKLVFADTFYYLAMVNDADAGHRRAMEFSAGYHGMTLTTEWVLTEVADALAAPMQRPALLELVDSLIHDSTVTIIEVKHEDFSRGLDLFAHRFDKAWSLTDCISFNVMQDHGVVEALTADITLPKRDSCRCWPDDATRSEESAGNSAWITPTRRVRPAA